MIANQLPTNVESVSSLLLELRPAGSPIGTATGFIVRRPNTVYLVTNRHVALSRSTSRAAGRHSRPGLPRTN